MAGLMLLIAEDKRRLNDLGRLFCLVVDGRQKQGQ